MVTLVVTFGEPLLQLSSLHAFTLTNPGACPSKAPLCVHSKRLRVNWQHAHMCLNMWTRCQYTRGRLYCTHRGALDGHTAIFSARHTTHHTVHTTHNHTHHRTQHTQLRLHKHKHKLHAGTPHTPKHMVTSCESESEKKQLQSF